MTKGRVASSAIARIQPINFDGWQSRCFVLPGQPGCAEIALLPAPGQKLDSYFDLADYLTGRQLVVSGLELRAAPNRAAHLNADVAAIGRWLGWRGRRRSLTLLTYGYSLILATRALTSWPGLANRCRLVGWLGPSGPASPPSHLPAAQLNYLCRRRRSPLAPLFINGSALNYEAAQYLAVLYSPVIQQPAGPFIQNLVAVASGSPVAAMPGRQPLVTPILANESVPPTAALLKPGQLPVYGNGL